MIASLLLVLMQTVPADMEPEPTIVVEGQTKSEPQIREEAHGFVRAIAAQPGSSGQLGRWNQPICPKLIGATPAEEALVLERLQALAADAGVRQANQKRCTPNILIAFTADPKGVVREVLKRRPHAARALGETARQALSEGDFPVRWWYDLKVESRFGETPVGDSPALLGALTTTAGGPGAGAGGQIAQSEHQSGNVAAYNSSIIGTATRQSIGAATIIVDPSAVKGVPREALASFIALVALAPLRLPPDQVSIPTITNLFQAPEDRRALDLTEWDRAYVSALYNTAANRGAKVQKGAISSRIARFMRGEEKRP